MPIRFTRPVDKDVRAWMNAVQGAGGSVSGPQQGYVQGLITSLKAANVWSSLDRLWLFAAENATQALIDLKARATATAVNSPAFTANRGYLGNGTTAYVDSNFNASTAGGNYVRDDASYGVWIETTQTAIGATQVQMGNDETNFGHILKDTTDTNILASINAASADISFAMVTKTGLWHVQRTASNAQELFQNGSSVGTSSNASVAVANRNFNILAGNNAGVPYRPTTSRLASAHIGKSLSANPAFYAALRTYMTAVGVA